MPLTIGLTYDLRSDYLAEGYTSEQVAEFDSDETLALIEQAIRSLGYATERIGNGRRLCQQLAAGRRWDLVFNIAEGLAGRSREAQVPCLLELYGVPYTFSDPLVCAVTLDKAVAKRLVQSAGLRTPAFAVVARPEDVAGLKLAYPLFAKPLAEGTGKGVDDRSRVSGPAELDRICRHLLERFRQSVLVEEFLPGREFTTALLGDGQDARVLGTMEFTIPSAGEQAIYSYDSKEKCERLVKYFPMPAGELRQEVEALALAAYRVIECRDAGRVDIRLDRDGRPSFMEVNPLPGLHPSHSDLPMIATQEGMAYGELIGSIIRSALARRGTGVSPVSIMGVSPMSVRQGQIHGQDGRRGDQDARDTHGRDARDTHGQDARDTVLVLHNVPRAGEDGAAFVESDAGVMDQVRAVERALAARGVEFRTKGIRSLQELPVVLADHIQPVVFNLVEGLGGDARPANLVPAVCRAFGRGVTGSDTPALELGLDKWRCKNVLRGTGLPVPIGFCVPVGQAPEESISFEATVNFVDSKCACRGHAGGQLRVVGVPPASGAAETAATRQITWIVKPAQADASEGIDSASIVSTRADLEAAVGRVHGMGQAALVEEYIDGRELNVSVLVRDGAAQVLPLAEIDFSAFPPGKPRIVDYAAKWKSDSFEYRNTPRVIPAPLDEATADKVRELALAAFAVLGCQDYARVDFRLDADGMPWILEVNANPDITPDVGFAAALAAAGIAYEDFVAGVVASAAARAGADAVCGGTGFQPVQAQLEKLCHRGGAASRIGPPPDGLAIRRGEGRDRDVVLDLMRRTTFFRDDEIEVAREVLDEALAHGSDGHYQSYVADADGRAIGWVCFGPTPCCLGTFDIYWIAVDPDVQAKGVGRTLLAHAEELIRQGGGRLAIVETNGQPRYLPTRRFYLRTGYHEAARVADFYSPGDDKVVYAKRLADGA